MAPTEKPLAVRFSGSFYQGQSPIFSDMDMTLSAGCWTCLLGPSGVGKSTCLKIIADLPTGGSFSGQVSADDGLPIKDRVSYMAQSDLLYPWLSVLDNVLLGQRLRGEKIATELAMELIHQTGLEKHFARFPRELSGGMRQRVALARTLMEDTPVVLLDEPFSALDVRTRREMQDLSFKLLKNRTVLLVTHDAAEALRLAHRLFVMSATSLDVHEIDAGAPLRSPTDEQFILSQSRLLHRLNQPSALDV